jgi:hypothetical protein
MKSRKVSVELPSPPEHGVHSSIMGIARKLCTAGLTQESSVAIITQWRNQNTFRSGRTVSDRELTEAINTAYNTRRRGVLGVGIAAPSPWRWPPANPEKRASLIKPGFDLGALWENSPWRHPKPRAYTRFFLENLFPCNPLVCMGADAVHFDTLLLSEWRNPEGLQFVVPSPMSARRGQRRDGTGEGAHTLSNTGPRRYIVVDFDDYAGPDIHAGAAWHLGSLMPLAMVVSTGGKGLHAWYKVGGLADEKIKPFFSLAVECGGDPMLWTRSQFARIPDGCRENGHFQRVFYFNPEAC